MSTRKKCAWLLVGTAALCALIIVGGKLYAAARDPLAAFEKTRALPTPTAAVQESSLSSRASAPSPAPQSESAAVPAPTATPSPAETLGSDTIVIALLGTDSNAAREAAEMGERSDVMVLLVIDAEDGECDLLTLPRDTRCKVQRLNAKGEVRSTRTDKLNAAFAYGGGDVHHSANNVLWSMEQLLGVDLNYYAVLDMDAISPLVEAVGGVTVTMPYDIKGVGDEGEQVTLSGETAYTFLRKRKGVEDGSDLARTARQQLFLKAFAQRVKALGLDAVSSLWAAASGYVDTNLSLSQAVALGSILSNLDVDSIDTHTLPGRAATIDGTSYYKPDADKIRELVEALF